MVYIVLPSLRTCVYYTHLIGGDINERLAGWLVSTLALEEEYNQRTSWVRGWRLGWLYTFERHHHRHWDVTDGGKCRGWELGDMFWFCWGMVLLGRFVFDENSNRREESGQELFLLMNEFYRANRLWSQRELLRMSGRWGWYPPVCCTRLGERAGWEWISARQNFIGMWVNWRALRVGSIDFPTPGDN